MRWEFLKCDAINLMVVIFHGQFTVDDYVQMGEALLARPDWQPGTPCLGDFTDCSFDGITTVDLSRALAEHIVRNDRMGPTPIAFLMPELVQYGLGRSYETRIEDHISGTVRVFRTRDEAYEWLMESA